MILATNKFEDPKSHHPGWFAFYRFGNSGFEIWFGHRYWSLNL